jgi:hypothetical protein
MRLIIAILVMTFIGASTCIADTENKKLDSSMNHYILRGYGVDFTYSSHDTNDASAAAAGGSAFSDRMSIDTSNDSTTLYILDAYSTLVGGRAWSRQYPQSQAYGVNAGVLFDTGLVLGKLGGCESVLLGGVRAELTGLTSTSAMPTPNFFRPSIEPEAGIGALCRDKKKSLLIVPIIGIGAPGIDGPFREATFNAGVRSKLIIDKNLAGIVEVINKIPVAYDEELNPTATMSITTLLFGLQHALNKSAWIGIEGKISDQRAARDKPLSEPTTVYGAERTLSIAAGLTY